jgi:asparagine synthase (glutamine-hydrolysing)
MCGIICGQSKNININEVKNSLIKLNHRGPDESNSIILNDAFLGHTRLSIVDLINGQQPISNENNNIYAVVNGEFYDYQDIKNKLIKNGHVFKTNSDSEILIHLYEEYGTNCLKYLHGEFAFVLYDKSQKRWFAARDRIGIRPLQYYFNNNNFFIASEAKSLFSFNNIKAEFDKESFWFSQHLQYLPLDKTIFKNIDMIKPGHYLIFNDNDVPKQYCYWNLKDIKQNNNITFHEAKEKAVDLINKAVEKRIPKEVSWTTHLSGGIDSSIVSSIAHAKNINDKVSFTIQFTDDNFYDESILAQETANHIGVKLIKIPVTFSDILSNIPKAVYHSEGLSINGHLGAKYILNKTIKEHGFKVAMIGEGADELFMGYSHLKQDYLSSNSLQSMEKQYLTGFQLPDENTLDLTSINETLGFIPTWIAAKSSMAFKFKSLWNKDFNLKNNPYDIVAKDLLGYSSKLKACSASWTQYCLNGYILKVLDDAQSMAHGVEGRLPFLDTELIEYMYSIPDNLYFYENIEKGILREGFKDSLPKNIINKTKQSFMSPPVNRFLKDKQFKSLIEEFIFDNNNFKNLEIFDLNLLEGLILNSTKNQADNFEPIIMTVLCTGIIAKKFL